LLHSGRADASEDALQLRRDGQAVRLILGRHLERREQIVVLVLLDLRRDKPLLQGVVGGSLPGREGGRQGVAETGSGRHLRTIWTWPRGFHHRGACGHQRILIDVGVGGEQAVGLGLAAE
jgi:hypothetical protein